MSVETRANVRHKIAQKMSHRRTAKILSGSLGKLQYFSTRYP